MIPLRNYILTLTIVTLVFCGNAQLSPNFYSESCPTFSAIVRVAMTTAVSVEARMAASILRLHFHDCFVNGCDASILLDGPNSEQNAVPNANSVRGYEVIDIIKTLVEVACPATVSCADILTLAARDATVLAGGPTWNVPLGRRDARTASLAAANSPDNLPPPFASLPDLIENFRNHGLSARDMVALSGSHTIGFAHCPTYRDRIHNDTNIDPTFATTLRGNCPSMGGNTNLAPLDTTTTNTFDNAYYTNLMNQRGLLHSDQELFNGGSVDDLVRQYSTNGALFRNDFAAAMVRMGNIRPLTGTEGEIRRSCGVVN